MRGGKNWRGSGRARSRRQPDRGVIDNTMESLDFMGKTTPA
jgi:hypothetical protein